MGRRKSITEPGTALIHYLHEDGYNKRDICTKINKKSFKIRSRTELHNVFTLRTKYGKNYVQSRPPVSSER